jgi:hypothetical protein
LWPSLISHRAAIAKPSFAKAPADQGYGRARELSFLAVHRFLRKILPRVAEKNAGISKHLGNGGLLGCQKAAKETKNFE